MVRDISGLGGPPNQETRTTSNNPSSSSKTTADSSTAELSTPKTVKQDNVELSSHVKNLQTLTEKISDLPEVNESRVAEIKAALERNELTINNERLADKLLAADDFLTK